MPRAPQARVPAALLLGLAASLWTAFRLWSCHQLEDALITFRYAANLATGQGLVYNPGEWVLGTTTPLWTLLLAALGAVAGATWIPTLGWILGILAGLGVLALHADLVADLGRPWTWIAVAIGVAHPAFLWSTTGGMETPLVLLGMAAALAARQREHAARTGILLGLLMLTRPDGVLFAGVVLASWGRDWRRWVRAGGVAAAVVVPWLIMATLLYGSPIPHSVLAKRAIAVPVESDAAWWWSSLAVARFGHLGWWIWMGLAGLGLASPHRGLRRLTAILLAFAGVYLAAFLIGDSPRFDWYRVPAAWATLLPGVIGAHALATRSGSWRRPRVVLAAMLLAFVGIQSGQKSWREAHDRHVHAANEVGLRRAVGEWLAANTRPDATVAMEAIGYQGWYSGRRVVDLAGLVSPEVVALGGRDLGNADRFVAVLDSLRPDLVVLRSFEVDEDRHFHGGPLFPGPDARSRFDASYLEIRRFHAPHPERWGNAAHLTVFARRSAQP